jgi:hypothetical protein
VAKLIGWPWHVGSKLTWCRAECAIQPSQG